MRCASVLRHAAAGERVQLFIARSGMWSRREAEQLIGQGRVTVNGAPITVSVPVMPGDDVRVDSQPVVAAQTTRVWLANKMRGELVTRSDPQGRPTIFDRLRIMGLPQHLIPVGRLDFSTEGLLVLTNNGRYARFLTQPASDIPRRYRARVHGPIQDSWLKSLRRGACVNGVRYKPIVVNVLSQSGTNSWLELVLREGKNREVRHVLGVMKLNVNRLIRTDFGPYSLGNIPRGAVKEVPLKTEGIGGWDPVASRGITAADLVATDPGAVPELFPGTFEHVERDR